jgi:hypothetical protein
MFFTGALSSEALQFASRQATLFPPLWALFRGSVPFFHIQISKRRAYAAEAAAFSRAAFFTRAAL